MSAPFRLRALSAACALTPWLSLAAPPSTSPDPTLPTVQVPATALPADAQVHVIDRAQITASGDASLQDLLRRLPGVSVDAEGRISLRGMGQGLTQMVLNGRQMGELQGEATFDNLPLQMVERVEVVRGASASDSGAGIAGTIRITTRRASADPERSLRLRSGWGANGQYEHTLGLATGGAAAALQWQMNLEAVQRQAVRRNRSTHQTTNVRYDADLDTVLTQDDRSTVHAHQRTDLEQLHWAGEVAWQPDARDRLSLSWRADFEAEHHRSRSTIEPTYYLHEYDYHGTFDASEHQAQRSHSPSWTFSPTLHWERTFDHGARLQASAGVQHARSPERSSYTLHTPYYDEDGSSRILDVLGERHASLRWEQPLSTTQRLTVGTEARNQRYTTTEWEDGEPERQRLQRQVRSAFAQWHWQPHAQWSLTSGLRHEDLHLELPGDSGLPARRDRYWLPSLHLAWQAQPTQRWHAELSRSYRAPTLRHLLPRLDTSTTGDLADPYYRGNFQLRNELSTNLELGVEQAIHTAGRVVGQWDVNLFARRIQHSLTQEMQFWAPAQGTYDYDKWVLRPTNLDTTRALGVEAGVRYDFAQLPAAHALRAPVAVHSHLTLTQSRVDGQAAPARLNGQSPAVLDVGVDLQGPRDSWLPLRWGAGLRYEAGYSSRSNPVMVLRQQAMTTVHLHALWQLAPTWRLRGHVQQLGSDWRATAWSQTPAGVPTRTTLQHTRPWQAAVMLERDF